MVEWWRKLAEELLPLQLPPDEQEGQQGRGPASAPGQQGHQERCAAEPAAEDRARPAETCTPSRAETGEV